MKEAAAFSPEDPSQLISLYQMDINPSSPADGLEVAASTGLNPVLIRERIGLPVAIAVNFVDSGVPLADLIQAGNWGLLKAAGKFDPTLGCSSSTYAYKCIRGEIIDEINRQGSRMSGAEDLIVRQAKLANVIANWRQNHGTEPTDEELADQLGVTVRRIANWKKYNTQTVACEDLARGQEGDGDWREDPVQLVDPHGINPEEYLLEKERSEILRGLLGKLPETELAVVTALFGLDGGEERRQEVAAAECGLNINQVKYTRRKALSALRGDMNRYRWQWE
jgi:RNA polymerase sigma factor (sigma-70 family)